MTDQTGNAWPALLDAQGRIADRLDRDLIDQADITLAEFEVLDHLAGSAEHTVRMNELAEHVRLSPSGLTRRFDTLVRRGWVTREPCDDDRRGINARLTTDGLAKHALAVGVHDAGVSTYMLDNLDEHEAECLTRVLGRLGELNTIKRGARVTEGATASG
ncbi:MAG: winged helix-turn-helix transcriptional regulator [Actinomycetia bacterium]|nr:winged helix-turn-helix transcriptional regulator [Actinomycetes bacterium]